MKNSNKMPKVFYLWALLSLITAVLIFYFSSQNGQQSGNLSAGIVTKFLSELVPSEYLIIAEGILRKLAHFSIYLLFGLCLYNSAYFYKDIRSISASCFVSLALAAVYAVSDEIHQLFVPGRTGALRDVLIDTAGAMCGILVAGFFLTVSAKKHNK